MTKDFKVFWAKEDLVNSSNFELEISKSAIKLLKSIYSPDILYRATGIYLFNLTCTKNLQISLFDELKQNENVHKNNLLKLTAK